MLRNRWMPALLPSLLTGLLLACGGGDTAKDEAAADAAVEEMPSDTADAQTSTPATTAGTTNAPVAPEDIDRWVKGMEGELKAVQEAGTRMKQARTSEDTLNAMMGVQEMNTIEAGAKAAGLELERYRFVRSNLSSAVGYLAPEIGGPDPATMPKQMQEEMKQANETQLAQMAEVVPADVVSALQPRAAALRKQDMELAGARLRAVGAGQ